MPPLVGVAAKVTATPWHILFCEAAIATEAFTDGNICMLNLLELTTTVPAQALVTVTVQLTVSLAVNVLTVNALLLLPAFTPFTFHWYTGLMPPLTGVAVNMFSTPRHTVLPFAEFARSHPYEVRFIEFMPFDRNDWSASRIVPYAEMRRRIESVYRLTPIDPAPNAVAKEFTIGGGVGRVGFVTSMTENFCASCNRLRLTADGKLKNCLFSTTESDLREPMRAGATDAPREEIECTAPPGWPPRRLKAPFRARPRYGQRPVPCRAPPDRWRTKRPAPSPTRLQSPPCLFRPCRFTPLW